MFQGQLGPAGATRAPFQGQLGAIGSPKTPFQVQLGSFWSFKMRSSAVKTFNVAKTIQNFCILPNSCWKTDTMRINGINRHPLLHERVLLPGERRVPGETSGGAYAGLLSVHLVCIYRQDVLIAFDIFWVNSTLFGDVLSQKWPKVHQKHQKSCCKMDTRRSDPE